jgi:hypothetical protein
VDDTTQHPTATQADSLPQPDPSPADAPHADPPAAPAVTVTTVPTQTKVRIETPGATVEVEAHASLDAVSAVALRLFREAGGWPMEDTRSTGFVHTERRETPPAQSSAMPTAPGAYPVQLP